MEAGWLTTQGRGKDFCSMPSNATSNGVVVLACDRDFGGGGNPGGNWQPECVTPTQLEQQGWQPYAESKDRVFYCRECKEGEAFAYRTQKYHPPILVK